MMKIAKVIKQDSWHEGFLKLRARILIKILLRLNFESLWVLLCSKTSSRQVDVTTAFLYGNIEEECYISARRVWRRYKQSVQLFKSICGLKQSSCCWNNRIVDFSGFFTPRQSDKCILVNSFSTCYITIYVAHRAVYKVQLDQSFCWRAGRNRAKLGLCQPNQSKALDNLQNASHKWSRPQQYKLRSCSGSQRTSLRHHDDLELNWVCELQKGLNRFFQLQCRAEQNIFRHWSPKEHEYRSCSRSDHLIHRVGRFSFLGTVSYSVCLLTTAITRNYVVTGRSFDEHPFSKIIFDVTSWFKGGLFWFFWFPENGLC